MNRLDELKTLKDRMAYMGAGKFGFNLYNDLITLIDWAIQQIEKPVPHIGTNPEIVPEDGINVDSKIRGGDPVIAGTRIAVRDIIGMLADEQNKSEICEDFDISSKQFDCAIEYILRALHQYQPVPQGDYDGAIKRMEDGARMVLSKDSSHWPETYRLALSCLEYCKSIKGV